ncbi:MAG: hypothetical protein HY799_02755 [Nitrosomonadales bacterium]|nr:hypothetical protein [Nitrosomonadales bacterium]
MKLKTTLLAATLAAFAASPVFANEEHHADDKTGNPETVKEKKVEAKKTVKKHSHAEEKSGMPMPETASGMGKQDSMKGMDMHDHTKDRH